MSKREKLALDNFIKEADFVGRLWWRGYDQMDQGMSILNFKILIVKACAFFFYQTVLQKETKQKKTSPYLPQSFYLQFCKDGTILQNNQNVPERIQLFIHFWKDQVIFPFVSKPDSFILKLTKSLRASYWNNIIACGVSVQHLTSLEQVLKNYQ